MTSSRTEYRKIRIDIIGYIIITLSKWLIMEKQEIEGINLPWLKNLKKDVEKVDLELNRKNLFSLT